MKDEGNDDLWRFPLDPEGAGVLIERVGGRGLRDRWFGDAVDRARADVTEWALGLRPDKLHSPSPDVRVSTARDLLEDLRVALVLCGDLAAEGESLRKKLRKNRKKKRKIAKAVKGLR